jgi:hypothetical protein
MTSRERLLTVLAGKVPDCVPVAPDFSNMIPARLTGKPFWDLYLFNDPPIWEAYIQCAKHFDIDSLMDGYFPLTFPGESPQDPTVERFIVRRDGERIVVQGSRRENGRRVWDSTVDVYYVADPPTARVPTAKLGLPPVPNRFEPLEGVKPVDTGPAGLKRVMETMGDQGLVGVWGGAGTLALDLPTGFSITTTTRRSTSGSRRSECGHSSGEWPASWRWRRGRISSAWEAREAWCSKRRRFSGSWRCPP